MPHKDPFLNRSIVPRPESANNSNYGATATAASRDVSQVGYNTYSGSFGGLNIGKKKYSTNQGIEKNVA